MCFYDNGLSYPSQLLQHKYEANEYVDCYRTLTTFRNDINVNTKDYKQGTICTYSRWIPTIPSISKEVELKFAKQLPDSVRHLPRNSQHPPIAIGVREMNGLSIVGGLVF